MGLCKSYYSYFCYNNIITVILIVDNLLKTVLSLFKTSLLSLSEAEVNRRMALFKEADDVVGIAGALDATAEVVMAEGKALEAADLLREAVKTAKKTEMKERQLKKYEATMTAEQANFYLQGQKYEEA